MSETKTNLRLKAVVQVSFQRSEATNLALFKAASHYPGDLKQGEVFLFISKMGNQLVFIFRTPIDFEDGKKTRRVTDSRRLRLDGGSWSPYMLQDYAHEVGLNLIGIKRFEEVHDEMRAAKRAKKR